MTDISFLVKSHDLFIKLSTYNERQNILSNLSNLNSHLANYQHANIASYLDILKTALRGYDLRLDKNRYIDFNSEIDNLRRKAINLDEEIKLTKARLIESVSLHTDITELKLNFEKTVETITEEKDSLITSVTNFTNEFKVFQELQVKATSNEALISTKLESVKESEVKFDTFIELIDEREKELSKQNEKTHNYNAQLINYYNENQRILEESEELIDKAKQALRYSTAEGISAAFSTQHIDANKLWMRLGWLIGAAIFIITTFVFGIWILTGWGIAKPNETITIIGRLSLIPFSLLGALFCANQYIKQKNLIEDYAYKSVLSKSMVAFSEELREKDPERYAEYLSTVLREIHQDPLRKRGKEKDEVSVKDSARIIDKLGELLKIVVSHKS